ARDGDGDHRGTSGCVDVGGGGRDRGEQSRCVEPRRGRRRVPWRVAVPRGWDRPTVPHHGCFVDDGRAVGWSVAAAASRLVAVGVRRRAARGDLRRYGDHTSVLIPQAADTATQAAGTAA